MKVFIRAIIIVADLNQISKMSTNFSPSTHQCHTCNQNPHSVPGVVTCGGGQTAKSRRWKCFSQFSSAKAPKALRLLSRQCAAWIVWNYYYRSGMYECIKWHYSTAVSFAWNVAPVPVSSCIIPSLPWRFCRRNWMTDIAVKQLRGNSFGTALNFA